MNDLESRIKKLEEYVSSKKAQQLDFPLDNRSFQILDKLFFVNKTYTPVLSNAVNVAVSDIYKCTVQATLDMVTVAGIIDIQATTGGVATSFNLSLPIQAKFNLLSDLSGCAISRNPGYQFSIVADTTNNVAFFDQDNIATNDYRRYSYIFQYQI